jgi:hypothetical protein
LIDIITTSTIKSECFYKYYYWNCPALQFK